VLEPHRQVPPDRRPGALAAPPAARR